MTIPAIIHNTFAAYRIYLLDENFFAEDYDADVNKQVCTAPQYTQEQKIFPRHLIPEKVISHLIGTALDGFWSGI